MPQLRRLIRLGPREQLRLGLSWWLLGASRLLIVAFPFSVVRRLLGRHQSSPDVPIEEIGPRQSARAQSIGRAVQRAANHTPWQSTCYPQALSARAQLVAARIPHTVNFGVRRDPAGAMVAHAWVRAGDVAVCGGDGGDYRVVGTFSWTPRHPRR